jgi:two-component system, OmpR family, sensor histidine kinase KdpD
MEIFRNVGQIFRGYLFAVLMVALATLVFIPGREYFAKGQWALLYLLIIVFVASRGGVRPAVLAAVIAFFSWNFFLLPPYHTFVIADPKDWISLFVFLAVGIAMGLQTGRMKWRESEAIAGEREAILLNRFSSYLVTEMDTAGMTEVLLGEIASTMSAASAALYLTDDEGDFSFAGKWPPSETALDDEIDRLAQWVHDNAKAIGLPSEAGKGLDLWPISISREDISPGGAGRDIFLPLQTASRVEGVLYVGKKIDGTDYSLHDTRLLVSIVNQAAAFRERRRLQHIANQAEALHEADQLKTVFVSSISHELKTPLASMTATVTSLLEEDLELDPAVVHSELAAISDDLSRLNDSINSLLDLSRLEANAWAPQRDRYEIGEIIGSAVSKIPQKQRGRIDYALPEGLPSIYVDFPQLARALQNLLENALAYSDQIVRIGASADEREFRIWVEDRGPGIDKDDRQRIFDKFYRGKASKNVPSGTGLGLAIAKEIVRSHGGRIWVEDVEPRGARFVIVLPNAQQEVEK